jgi:hypothetical protein
MIEPAVLFRVSATTDRAALVRAGARFEKGVLVERPATAGTKIAA